MRALGMLLITLFAGCASITDPVSLGDGRYMVTMNAPLGTLRSNGELLGQAIGAANGFCAKQFPGSAAVIDDTKVQGVAGWTPQDNQVSYHCQQSATPGR